MLKMTLNNLQLRPTKVEVHHQTDAIHKLKRLGAKAADGQTVTGGSILYRQRGTSAEC